MPIESLDTCELHENCVVLYEPGKGECPFCKYFAESQQILGETRDILEAETRMKPV